ncbi:unnamed protein product [Hymenolepis diminuta]|uniref:Uncharacterized protein n=1 Tax=Hymenolepis diminuta TaxID=6216 RepID=A0A564ZAX8_HYMDI|nr:unnamed protein product [Hymenolepis diminuta]
MVPLLGIEDTSDLISNLFVEGIDIPVEWRRWLAEARKTEKKQPIASTSMPSSSPEEKGQSFKSQERLASFETVENATRVCILNSESSEVEFEFKIPKRQCSVFFAFKDKLVLIGDSRNENTTGSRRVDMLDISTGQVSSLPDMIKAMCIPDGVATENEIFVYEIRPDSKSVDHFSKEVYEAALGRRVIFYL